MNTKEIEALLLKYYEGSTSLQDEKALRDFFQSDGVPDHLKPHQPLFRFFVTEQTQRINEAGFMKKMAERFIWNPAEMPVKQLKSNRNRFLFITSIAASILLLIGLFLTFQQESFRKSPHEKVTPNPELAYAEASEALMIVSSNLNSGLKEIEQLHRIDKALKNMQLFNKFYKYQTIIINPDEFQNQSIKSK